MRIIEVDIVGVFSQEHELTKEAKLGELVGSAYMSVLVVLYN